MNWSVRSALLAMVCLAPLAAAGANTPADNPLSTFYDADHGYPAWSDRIRWDRVIDMSRYAKGATAFEKFENARDELAEAGGGILYYPAGVYRFEDGPFDGPNGRGLMLRSGVVIRGEAPKGRARAVDGELNLSTRFVFGFQKARGALNTGERVSLRLQRVLPLISKPVTDKRGRVRHKEPRLSDLWLNLAAPGGTIRSGDVTLHARALVVGEQTATARVRDGEGGSTLEIETSFELAGYEAIPKASITIELSSPTPGHFDGTYQAVMDQRRTSGDVMGRFGRIKGEVRATGTLWV